MSGKEYLISEVARQFSEVRSDPTIVQRAVLDTIENVTDGRMVIMDANNPFALGMEMSVTLAVSNLSEARLLARQNYPSLTNDWDDLYRHMSDYDYKDVFAQPATATFAILMDKDELFSRTIDDPAMPGTRRFTIPRYTQVDVQNTSFTLLYPIDIRLVSHGGLLINYNYENYTPLHPLQSNQVQYDLVVIDNREFVRMFVDMIQVRIERFVPQLNASSGFSRDYPINEQFYFCRAFIRSGEGGWQEIRTTHSDSVYDPNVPTVVLRVLDDSLRVTVPQIYANNGLITDAVRLDIYTTRGAVNMSLESLPHTSYSTQWNRLNNESLTTFTAPILSLNRYMVYAPESVTGGRDGITFAELRRRVITRSLNTEGLPITRAQLSARLADLGYQLVTNIDNITDRQFLATRLPPLPLNGQTVNGVSAMIGSLQETLTSLELSESVIKNNRRDTIKPSQLYELRDGKLFLVPDIVSKGLWELQINSADTLARELNSKNYLYSPYYYVVDTNVNEFNCRVYDFDNPKIDARFFNTSNLGLGINLSFVEHSIEVAPTGDGYLLKTLLEVGDTAKQLGPDFIDVQLSYKGRGDENRYVIPGRLLNPIDPDTGLPSGGSYLYEFHIQTRYDVDDKDGLIPTPYKSPVNLIHEFDVVTIIKGYNPNNVPKSDIDTLIDLTALAGYDKTKSYLGVSHEKLKLNFGSRLKYIWQRTRSIMEYDVFERYESDVVDVYDRDIYETDATGLTKLTHNKENNSVTMNKLFSKGQRKLDRFGDTIYAHRKGEVVMNALGDPVFKDNGRGIERHMDLFLLDARYRFANKDEDEQYRNMVRKTIADWCIFDMARINDELLERSEIFYYPIRTTGIVEVLADNDLHVSVNAEQSFKVTYWLRQDKYQNSSLRETIERQTIESIHNTLNRKTVSQDSIVDDLRLILSGSVVGVAVSGFTQDKYTTVTLKDASMGLTIAKRIRVMSNNQLEIVNDVEVEFLTHGE